MRVTERSLGAFVETSFSALGAGCAEACLAENWTATLFNRAWLERNLAGSTTLSTDSIVHIAWSGCALFLALVAAGLATLWSAQALACVKFLFTTSEREG